MNPFLCMIISCIVCIFVYFVIFSSFNTLEEVQHNPDEPDEFFFQPLMEIIKCVSTTQMDICCVECNR